jgi:hypothetical protein
VSRPGTACKQAGRSASRPAMANLRLALRSHRLGTALTASYPPSVGAFREDIAESVILPLLRFLNTSGSYYFVDAYPYFAWAGNARPSRCTTRCCRA